MDLNGAITLKEPIILVSKSVTKCGYKCGISGYFGYLGPRTVGTNTYSVRLKRVFVENFRINEFLDDSWN